MSKYAKICTKKNSYSQFVVHRHEKYNVYAHLAYITRSTGTHITQMHKNPDSNYITNAWSVYKCICLLL